MPTYPELRKTFKKYDADGSNTLDIHELRNAFSDMGLRISPDHAQEIIDKNSSMQKDFLTFREFAALFDEEKLRLVYDEIDKDNNGVLDKEELKAAFGKLGVKVSGSQIKQIITNIDSDQSGNIDFDEFKKFCSGIPGCSMLVVAQHMLSATSLDTGSEVGVSLPPSEIPVWRFLLAGCIGGGISRTLTAPFERIKILCQVGAQGEASIGRHFRRVMTNDGLKGLFYGNWPSLLKVAPFAAMVCAVYTSTLKLFPNHKENIDTFVRLGSGAIAGLFAAASTYPLDLLRARMSMHKETKMTLKQVYSLIVKTEGYKGLYKGLSPTLLSVVPFIAMQQTSYDLMRINIPVQPSVASFLSFGIIAGACAQTLTHPIDLLRRNFQVYHHEDRRILHNLKEIYRKERIRGLFKGLTPALLKVAPAVATSLVIRDMVLGRI